MSLTLLHDDITDHQLLQNATMESQANARGVCVLRLYMSKIARRRQCGTKPPSRVARLGVLAKPTRTLFSYPV